MQKASEKVLQEKILKTQKLLIPRWNRQTAGQLSERAKVKTKSSERNLKRTYYNQQDAAEVSLKLKFLHFSSPRLRSQTQATSDETIWVAQGGYSAAQFTGSGNWLHDYLDNDRTKTWSTIYKRQTVLALRRRQKMIRQNARVFPIDTIKTRKKGIKIVHCQTKYCKWNQLETKSDTLNESWLAGTILISL